MWRRLSALAVGTSTSVLKTSASCVRLTARSFTQRSNKPPDPKMKFKIGGGEKLNDPSRLRDLLDWMATEEGRQRVAIILGTGGAITVSLCSWCFNILSMEVFTHEYCLPQDKESLNIVSSESSQLQPGPELRRLMALCQSRARVEVDNMDRLSMFHTELMDPVSNGCLRSAQGAAIGLPQHFTNDNIDLKTLLVKTGYNRWFKGFKLPEDLSAEDEAELKSCLTLTKEEKEFAVSQRMAAVNSWHSVYHLVMPPVLWLLGYSLGHTVNNKLDLFSKSRVFRVFSVCWTGAVISLSYIYFINALSLETDTDCYKLICSKSEEAEAGISYYQKILRRNVLLRRLLGQQMEYYIQESGEYVPMIYEIEDYRNISTKIKSLEELREELRKTD